MDVKRITLIVFITTLGASSARAGDEGIPPSQSNVVIALQGGDASVQASRNARSFIGSDSDVFTYTNSGAKNSGFIGGFLGIERCLPWTCHPFFMQYGMEYNYFARAGIHGINTVGIEPDTITTYNYNYNSQMQQLLGTFRFFASCYERFHPYAEVGLGAAFNHSSGYTATTTEVGSLNLTPGFNDHPKTSFSYSLGLGVDGQVNTCLRMGLGYRFSDFGSNSLGDGVVSINNYQAPVPFVLGSSKVYAHQLIARISYLV